MKKISIVLKTLWDLGDEWTAVDLFKPLQTFVPFIFTNIKQAPMSCENDILQYNFQPFPLSFILHQAPITGAWLAALSCIIRFLKHVPYALSCPENPAGMSYTDLVYF